MHDFLSLSVFSHTSLWMYNEFLQFPFRPGEIVPDLYVVVTVVLLTGWQIEAIDFDLDLRFSRSLSKYNTLNFRRGRHRRWYKLVNIVVISINAIPCWIRCIFKFVSYLSKCWQFIWHRPMLIWTWIFILSKKGEQTLEQFGSKCVSYLQFSNSCF